MQHGTGGELQQHLTFSMLLYGRTSDSAHTELGAIFEGLRRVLTAVEGGNLHSGSRHTLAVGVQIDLYTNCKSMADTLDWSCA